MRPILAIFIMVLGCSASDAVDDRGKDIDGIVDTDSAQIPDTVIDDTAIDDTAPPPHVRPARLPRDWGDGFVAIDAAITEDRFPIEAGDPGLGIEGDNTAVFWGDLDNDSVPELIVATTAGDSAPQSALALRWTPSELLIDETLTDALMLDDYPPLGAVDLDGDGFTDLLQAREELLARWGAADGTFSDWYGTDRPTAQQSSLTQAGQWITLADIDADGWIDLWVTSGTCLMQQPHYRVGTRKWETNLDTLVPLWTSIPSVAPVMPIWNDDGAIGLFAMFSRCIRLPGPQPWEVTDESHPGFYTPISETDNGMPVFDVFDPTSEAAWWKLEPAHVDEPLTSLFPHGAAGSDIDGDGRLDFIMSAGRERQPMLRGTADATFEAPEDPLSAPAFPWALGFPDLDLDGRPELIFTIGYAADSFSTVQGQPMQNAVYWSGGTFSFESITDHVSLDVDGNWRALSMADPDGDGDADIAIGGKGHRSGVWRNDIDVGRQGISIRLQGTTSNHLGIGAKIEVFDPWLPIQTQWMGAVANPVAFTEPVVFFGGGKQGFVEMVRVTWPSGTVQEFANLPTGEHHQFVEPVVIAMSEPDRHLPADGTTELTVWVTPRTPAGELDPAADVTLELVGEPALVTGLVNDGLGTWTATIQAPTQSGSTQVRVAINGDTVKVRPRVWWD